MIVLLFVVDELVVVVVVLDVLIGLVSVEVWLELVV